MLQFVGKLRVRLSCLQPNHSLSADLPLLGERSRGARVVGGVRLTLQASYASLVREGPIQVGGKQAGRADRAGMLS